MPANQQEKKGITVPAGVGDHHQESREGGMYLELRSFTGVPLGVAMPVINISCQFQQTGPDNQRLITTV